MKRASLLTLALPLLLTACGGDPSPALKAGGVDIEVSQPGKDGKVAVLARGLHAGTVSVAICQHVEEARFDAGQHCDLTRGSRADVSVNAQGMLKTSMFAPAYMGIRERKEVSCFPKACDVVLLDAESKKIGASVLTAAPARAQLTPSLHLRNLTWGPKFGTANLVGAGFPANFESTWMQCPEAGPAPDVHTDDCLYDDATSVTSDAQGQFTTKIRIWPRFERSSGNLVDCIAKPDSCAIATPWPGRSDVRMARILLSQASGG